MNLQTEYEFTLPQGFVDKEGTLHRDGVMRLATAFDEVAPMKDPRVQNNPAYLTVILLSRVIKHLGELENINPKVIEELFIGDFDFLQDFYRRINGNGGIVLPVTCPECEVHFNVEIDGSGEQSATP
jgi:hypothetical protein